MPRKITTPVAKPAKVAAKAVSSTPVRNTPIPKAAKPAVAAVAPKVITHEMIAVRAYEISMSPNCGSEVDNWCRAERELRGM